MRLFVTLASKKRRRWKWRFNLKMRLHAQQNGLCWLCGKPMPEPIYGPKINIKKEVPTLDHVIPRSKGGRFAIANFKLAHMGCNSRRGCADVNSPHTVDQSHSNT